MANLFRSVSLLLRRRQSEKAVGRILDSFYRWKKDQESLPGHGAKAGKQKMLLIRLDDIGDYLLFRNSFGIYRGADRVYADRERSGASDKHENKSRWSDHEIVLLGNSAWKELFIALDKEKADRVIWVDKGEYLRNTSYRQALWIELRREGFGAVICPARTRPLLLDDLCALATGAPERIGIRNTFIHPEWNQLSDSLYTKLYPDDPLIHEFIFNARFAACCCGVGYEESRPEIERSFFRKEKSSGAGPEGSETPEPYILCFIGSSTKSKRWPLKRWIGLIGLMMKKYPFKIIIAGGKQEIAMGGLIKNATGALSIAGNARLTDMIAWVSGAKAVITNDTMAAHLGASCHVPTIIIGNGTNSMRFTEYARAGIGNVITVYPGVFLREREKRGNGSFHHVAVSADIASITPELVMGKLEEVIHPAGR